jgi:ribosomal protein S27E
MNVTCPECKNETLVLGDGNPRCSGCGYTADAVKAADRYIEDVLGESRYGIEKDGGTWPRSDCPGCDMTSFVHGDSDRPYICFQCGESWKADKLSWCEEGGGHFFIATEEGDIICRHHFNEKINDDD